MAATAHDRRAPVARTRIWRSMRILRRFTVPDLAATADASVENTRKYLRDLTRARYVRKITIEVPRRGVEGRAIFALVKDTGPFAPSHAAGGIFDPNILEARVKARAGGGGGCGSKSGSRGCAANAGGPVRPR